MLLVGDTGVGKSHIAQALGHRACRAGYHVLYVGAHDMLTQLRAARDDDSLARRLLRFTTPDLLIVDDIGLRGLTHDEPLDLYEIIRTRYQRASTIMTSNRSIEEWPPLFGDALLASATSLGRNPISAARWPRSSNSRHATDRNRSGLHRRSGNCTLFDQREVAPGRLRDRVHGVRRRAHAGEAARAARTLSSRAGMRRRRRASSGEAGDG